MPDELCELCGNPSEMNFNMAIPHEGQIYVIQGFICFDCFGNADSDVSIARNLLIKRKEKQDAIEHGEGQDPNAPK